MKYLKIFNKNKLLILLSLYNCDSKTNICGCNLVEKLNIPKNLVSYHMKILHKFGLVTEIKCGRRKKYKLSVDHKADVKKILLAVHLISS